ncbi:hypothetical protein [Bacillus sp. Au-Bac7]|uniref:hypothetical protein n=1 Tax=Bacillus sp. Au-Bac7 TaxID=2906458 RepID=UPI001E563971|nr:hypothetical protein [Bacillus sp. Au-Bac7]MCE4051862.1 hypothetical protein [Bacillus sp. Au-Bac7]
MRKSICLSLLTLSLAFTSSGFASAAEVTEGATLETQIQNLSESNLSDNKKETEFLNIVENAPKSEQEAYIEDVAQTVEEGLQNLDVDVEPGKDVEVDLGDNITLDFSSDDTSEGGAASNGITTYALNGYDYSNGNVLSKAYGNRRFTATVSVKSYGATIGSLKLVNRYSVGTYGLKFREVSTAGTSGVEPFVYINSSSAKVTDSKAEKVGYNMNARGEYSWKMGIGAVTKSFTSEIYSTIKLRSWDKSKKTVVVGQSYSFTE